MLIDYVDLEVQARGLALSLAERATGGFLHRYQDVMRRVPDLTKMKLKEAGISVWLDHGELRGGEEWRDSIDRGISNSHVMLVVLTPKSCESPYVTYEWGFALGKGKKVIPIRSPCQESPAGDLTTQTASARIRIILSNGQLPWTVPRPA